VGSIVLDFDTDVVTNNTKPASPYYNDKSYCESQTGCLSNYKNSEVSDDCVRFTKGQMTGRFEMGSTIVLIWEAAEATQIIHTSEG